MLVWCPAAGTVTSVRMSRWELKASERIQLAHHIDHVSTGGWHRDFCAQCDDARLLADLTQTRTIDLVEVKSASESTRLPFE